MSERRRNARGRGALAALAALVALAALAPAAGAAKGARAAARATALASLPRWSEVFAAETDTVVFVTPDALVRAPFSMTAADTLWRGVGDERIARVLTSPDGRRLAWLARASDRAPTTLWVWDAAGVRRRAQYLALVPSDYGTARFDAGQPSLDDADATGGRFTTSGTLTRTSCANALAWDWDGSALWAGYRDGIAHVPADTARVRVMSPALALGLRRLDPAPMLYAEVIRLGEGRDPAMLGESSDYERSGTGLASGRVDPSASSAGGRRLVSQPGAYVMYPAGDRLRTFQVTNFDPSDPWTASPATVWWLDHERRVSAVRAGDPRGTLEFEDHDPIVWLEYVPARRTLVRASGRTMRERGESGGDRVVLATGSPIRAVLAAPGDPVRVVVTADSLIVWDPSGGVTQQVALDGAAPVRVLDAADGARVIVSGERRRDAIRLDRLDPGATKLVSLAAPRLELAAVALTPSGRRLLLYPATERAPAVVQVGAVAGGGWSTVELPGVLGWERPIP